MELYEMILIYEDGGIYESFPLKDTIYGHKITEVFLNNFLTKRCNDFMDGQEDNMIKKYDVNPLGGDCP